MQKSGKEHLKLHIENFQAISDIDMDFEQGINIIVGQSNSGKTSVLRAVDTVVNNASGSAEFIKKGTNRSTINMEYNGNEVQWSRTNKEIEYAINGEKFLKVGTTNLFKLLPENGFVLDPQGEFSNLEDEWTLPFPFYKSGSEIFKLFENIFSVSDSAKILKDMKDNEDRCKRELQDSEKEVSHVDLKIESIKKLNIEESVGKLKEYKNNLTYINNELEELYETINELYKLQNKLAEAKKIPSKLDIDLQSELQDFSELHEELYKINQLKLEYNVISKLPKNSIVVDTVLESINNALDIKEDLGKLDKFNKVLSISIPTTPKVNENTFNEIHSLHEHINSLKCLQVKGKRLVQALREKREEISSYKQELSKVKICPLCGSSVKECGEFNY